MSKTNRSMSKKTPVARGSGNVFADLGLDNPKEELLKGQLVREIRDILKRRRLAQSAAGALLGLKQPDVSALVTGRDGVGGRRASHARKQCRAEIRNT